MKRNHLIAGFLLSAFMLCVGRASLQAATVASQSVMLQVTIDNTLNITATPALMGLGNDIDLGDAAALVTQTIGITNNTGSVLADLSLSCTNFGEPSGAALEYASLESDLSAPEQNEVTLGAIFLSPGYANVTSTQFDTSDGDNVVTLAAVEATNDQTDSTGGRACADNTDRFCAATADYPALSANGVTYYLGDGQNLSIGELVSLVLYFQPPPSLDFDASQLTATLFITASAGGAEE